MVSAKAKEEKADSKKEKSGGFEPGDVKAALMGAVVIIIVGLVTIPLENREVISGMRNMVWAPPSAVFLTMAAARIEKKFSLFIVTALACCGFVFESVGFSVCLLASAFLAEIFNLIFFRGYSFPGARISTITLFFSFLTPVETLWETWLVGKSQRRLLDDPFSLGLETLCVCVFSFAGCLVGERFSRGMKTPEKE